MYNLAESLRKISIMIKPYITRTSEKILEELGLNKDVSWDELYEENKIPIGTKVTENPEILFARLDKEQEVEYIQSAMHGGK